MQEPGHFEDDAPGLWEKVAPFPAPNGIAVDTQVIGQFLLGDALPFAQGFEEFPKGEGAQAFHCVFPPCSSCFSDFTPFRARAIRPLSFYEGMYPLFSSASASPSRPCSRNSKTYRCRTVCVLGC